MEKLTILILIFSSFLTISLGSCAGNKQSKADELDYPNLYLGKEKVTKLRFYLQDLVGGDNRTVWRVAQSNLTDILPSGFGAVYVLDNLVTSGPEIDSKEMGRMQGIVGFSDLHELALAMLLNIIFTEGEYKGSTLSILGRNPLNDAIREVPIVGGTGVFRMARGYVITRTYSVIEAHTYAVYEYNVVVFHYDDISLLSQE